MSFKNKLIESWKNQHLTEEDHGTHPGNKEDEKEDVKLIKKVVKKDCIKAEELTVDDIWSLTEAQCDDVLMEVLSKDADAGEWVHDFVHSKNPKFVGKSKAKRRQMALAAYYAKQRNEEIFDEEIDVNDRTKEELGGRVKSKQKDDVGPTGDFKPTKVRFHAGPKNEETEVEVKKITDESPATVVKTQKPEPRSAEDLKAKEGRGKQGMKEDIDPALLEALGLKHKLKAAGKKILSTLGHGDDESMRKDLQKKMGVPQTGKPAHAKQNEEVVLDEEDTKVKHVHHNGVKIGETGVDSEASPGNGKWFAKHYKSKMNSSGFDSRKEAEAEVRAAHGIKEEVEEGWDDMLKAAKERKGPQPSGGSGIKQGTRYGGGKQTSKPEHDEEETSSKKTQKEEVEQIDEISKETLSSYKTKAQAHVKKLEKDFDSGDRSMKRAMDIRKRDRGILHASSKIRNKDAVSVSPKPHSATKVDMSPAGYYASKKPGQYVGDSFEIHGKAMQEGKDPSMDAGCGSTPDFTTDGANKPLAIAKHLAKKASIRLKKDLAGK